MRSNTILRLAVLAVVLVQVAQGLESSDTRIVGGRPAGNKYKYFVRLHEMGKFICGGALVRNNAVITAAHCVKGGRIGDFVIHAGTTSLSNKGLTRKVKYVRYPQNYNQRTMSYDLAILILKAGLKNNAILPVPLQNAEVRVGTSCVVLGHGLKKERGKIAAALQEAWVPIIDKQRCQRNYRGTATLTNTMFCAAVPGEKDSCSGDSGGPLVCNGRLTGIVSFGVGCADKQYPGVYTDVQNMSGFITRELKRYA